MKIMKKSNIEYNENEDENLQPLISNGNNITVKQNIDLGDLIKELKKDKPKRKYKKRQQDLTNQDTQNIQGDNQDIQDIQDIQSIEGQSPPIVVRNGDSGLIQGSQGMTSFLPNDQGQKIPIPIPNETPTIIPEEMINELVKLYKDKTEIIKNAEKLGLTLPEEFIKSETAQLPQNPLPIQIQTLIDEIYNDNQQALDRINNLTVVKPPQKSITSNSTGVRPSQQAITTNSTGFRPQQQAITSNSTGERTRDDTLPLDFFFPNVPNDNPPSRIPKSILPPTPNNDPEAPDIGGLDDENLSIKELRDKLRKIKAYYRKINKPMPDMSKSPGYQKIRKDYEIEPSNIVKEVRELTNKQPKEFQNELENELLKLNQKIKKNEKINEPIKLIKPTDKKKFLTQKETLINTLREKGRNPPRDTSLYDLQNELKQIVNMETSPLNDALITSKEIEQQRKPTTIDTLFSNYGPPKNFLKDVVDIRKSGFGYNNTQGIQSMNIPPQTSLLDSITQQPKPQRNLLGQGFSAFSDLLSSSKGARDASAYGGLALGLVQPELLPAIGALETGNQALNIIENPVNSIERAIQERINNPPASRKRKDAYGGF